jgi:hypothetical protein
MAPTSIMFTPNSIKFDQLLQNLRWTYTNTHSIVSSCVFTFKEGVYANKYEHGAIPNGMLFVLCFIKNLSVFPSSDCFNQPII